VADVDTGQLLQVGDVDAGQLRGFGDLGGDQLRYQPQVLARSSGYERSAKMWQTLGRHNTVKEAWEARVLVPIESRKSMPRDCFVNSRTSMSRI
jgi:hypothetical protein